MSFEVKTCSKCGQNKLISEFELQRRACKICRYKIRKSRGRPKYPKLNTGIKTCSVCHLEKPRTEFHKYMHQPDGCSSRCKTCTSLKTEEFYKKNQEIIKQKRNKYYHSIKNDPKKRIRQKLVQKRYQNKRTKEDLFYKLARRLRNRLYYALKNKTWKKNTHFAEYIGCSPQELVAHIEAQFQPGMTWDNYGAWHIDHVRPLVSATSPEELYKLCHHTNLQPLWAPDNLRKNAQLVKP